MKNLCLLLLVFISINSSAQDISGLYSGTLTNDSLKMIQNYELALSEYKGKITGFSYITFVANDTFYYGIKRIKATRVNGELVVEDVQMLMNNYPQKADKGVHLINRIPLPNSDTITNLSGRWETTKTKRFYSISGDMSLRKDEDSTKSPLMAHLKELKMIDYQEERKQDNRNIAKAEQRKMTQDIKQVSKETKPAEPVVTPAVAKQTVAPRPSASTAPKPTQQENASVAETKPLVSESSTAIVSSKPQKQEDANNRTISTPTAATTTATQQKSSTENKTMAAAAPAETPNRNATELVVQNKTQASTRAGVNENKPVAEKPATVVFESNTSVSGPTKETALPEVIEKRVNNTIQTISVAADSLVLSFYDNGVVDGDSISVFLNGENIISKVKLKEAAVKKTIYLDGRADEIRLTLVAENLGSIPPNTGLLIIQDANEKYQIRFSADMETNAAVVIRKKKK